MASGHRQLIKLLLRIFDKVDDLNYEIVRHLGKALRHEGLYRDMGESETGFKDFERYKPQLLDDRGQLKRLISDAKARLAELAVVDQENGSLKA